MTSHTDKQYIYTKEIKQGKIKLEGANLWLMDWIYETYGVRPLNVYYNYEEGNHPAFIEIVFEFEEDMQPFTTAEYLRFEKDYEKSEEFLNDQIKKEAIADKYDYLIDPKYTLMPMRVMYSAFEPIAKEEAQANISFEDLEKLRSEIGDKDIWKIINPGIFFFNTQEQMKRNDNEDTKNYLKGKYFDLLKKYDEFDYFKRESLSIKLDSKDNFYKNYQSNWQYYLTDK